MCPCDWPEVNLLIRRLELFLFFSSRILTSSCLLTRPSFSPISESERPIASRAFTGGSSEVNKNKHTHHHRHLTVTMSVASAVCGLARPAFRVRASAGNSNNNKIHVATPTQKPTSLYLGKGAARKGSVAPRAIQVDTSADAKEAATQDPLMLRAIRGEDVERPPIWYVTSSSPSRTPSASD